MLSYYLVTKTAVHKLMTDKWNGTKHLKLSNDLQASMIGLKQAH